LGVPVISRLIATHYSYEALVVAQAKLNPLASRQRVLQEMTEALAAKPDLTENDEERLDDLKMTLAQLSGLEAGTAREIDRRLSRIDEIIEGSQPTKGDFKTKIYGVTASQLYENQKIADLVSKAETEQNDYRRTTKINTFFSPEKHHFYFGKQTGGWTMSVYFRNSMILLLSSAIMLVALWLVLKRQLQRSGV
jgi:hypothetical protein